MKFTEQEKKLVEEMRQKLKEPGDNAAKRTVARSLALVQKFVEVGKESGYTPAQAAWAMIQAAAYICKSYVHSHQMDREYWDSLTASAWQVDEAMEGLRKIQVEEELLQ